MTDFAALREREWLARRAPSAHNTQPWLLHYQADAIRLDFDPRRHLVQSDPGHRDLLLSLGTFVESLLIVASDAGLGLAFEAAIDLERHRIGWFRRSEDLYPTAFVPQDLLRRRTSRLPLTSPKLAPAAREALHSQLRAAERLDLLRGEEVRDLLGPADRHMLDEPGIAAELRQWLRHDGDAPDAMAADSTAADGLSSACLSLSALEGRVLAALLSPPVHPWFRRLHLAALLNALTPRLVHEDSTLLALRARGREPADVLEAGRSLMRLWLELGRMGLYVQPLSQILDFPETQARLAERLRVGADEHLLCLFRTGHSPPPALSRRLGETAAQRASLRAAAGADLP